MVASYKTHIKLKKDERRIFSTSELNDRNKGLQEITEILSNMKIAYFLTDGALLGAIREKDFIPWDWDVEIVVLTESIWDKVALFIEKAKFSGFKYIDIDQEYGNFKINFLKYGNKYSLPGLVLEGSSRVRNSFRYPKVFFESKSQVKFRGKIYPAPSDIEEYLTYQYGDWKTPPKDRYNKRIYLSKEIWRDSSFRIRIINKLRALYLRAREILSSLLMPVGYSGANREENFSDMYFTALQRGTNVVEIGSSDGFEIIDVLNRKECPGQLSFLVIEPSQYNIDKAKNLIKKNVKKAIDIDWAKFAIDKEDGKRNFYISKTKPNLNSFFEMPYHTHVKEVDTKNIISILKEYKISSPLLIKMDVEGHEVTILNSFLSELEEMTDVSILFELHPFAYSKDNSLEEVLRKLFEQGFKVTLAESAGQPIPVYFKKEGYEPFQIKNNRGMYKDVSDNFVLKYATCNTQDYLPDKSLSLKQVRSILIQKKM